MYKTIRRSYNLRLSVHSKLVVKLLLALLTCSLTTTIIMGVNSMSLESKDLHGTAKFFAVLDTMSKLESFVELTENEAPSSAVEKVNLKMEYINLAYDYFKDMDKALKMRVKANLPRVGTLGDVLAKNHGHYLRPRNLYSQEEEQLSQDDQEYLMKLSLEYKRSRWLRLKNVPELNPTKGSKLGDLIDLLVICACDALASHQNPSSHGGANGNSHDITTAATVTSSAATFAAAAAAATDATNSNCGRLDWNLVKLAEDEYISELESIITGDNSNQYEALERIESYFSQLVIRLINEKIFLGSPRPQEASELSKIFTDSLKAMGFIVESCHKLTRNQAALFGGQPSY